MRLLGRVNLYQRHLAQLENENGPIFQDMNLRQLLQINLSILTGIEELFLTDDLQIHPDPELNIFEIRQIFEANLINAGGIADAHRFQRLLETLRGLLESSGAIQSPLHQPRYFFHYLIRQLSAFNVKVMERPLGQGNNIINTTVLDLNRRDFPQVFCSHAYDDHLHTYSMFRYFYDNGIYLYLDWMHNTASDNGIELKHTLNRELERSEQLLFLRTTNSELCIRGKNMIRGWCSWEMGNYYGSGSADEKYLLNLYSVNNCERYNNLQLHGLKVLTGIEHRTLEGVKIDPADLF